MGRDTEFEAALRKLRGKKADISQEAAEIQVSKSCIYFFPCKMDKASHDLKTHVSFLTGLYRDSGKASESQDAGFVSEKIHTLCSCNKHPFKIA